MGCVFGKEASARLAERGREREGDRRKKEVNDAVRVNAEGEVRNGGNKQKEGEDGEDGGCVRPREREKDRRRSSRPNPRLSNPPKNVHGEQVAAGWPSWLSAVAGEAISGWTPRRADTFEKLDKVKRFIISFHSSLTEIVLVSFWNWFHSVELSRKCREEETQLFFFLVLSISSHLCPG